MDLYIIANDLRRDVQTLKTLQDADHLTIEHFKALTDRLLVNIDTLKREIEAAEEPPEYFHVTAAGFTALQAEPAETEPRDYGRLRCIDGGLS